MIFRTYEGFNELGSRYDEFFDHCAQDSLYLSRQWFLNLITTSLESSDQARFFAVEHEDGSPVLLLVLRSPAGQNGSIYSKWNITTKSLAGMTNFQSGYFAPLVVSLTDSEIELACKTMVRGILNEPENWHMIDLNLMDIDCRRSRVLAAAFRDAGFGCFQYFYKGNWHEDLSHTKFSDYLADREKPKRKEISNFQRKLRKLSREKSTEIIMYQGDDSVKEMLDVYRYIYERSWKEDDIYPGYMEGLISTVAEKGYARFLVVMVEGNPVAMEFAIVIGNKAVMVRTAYDTEYRKYSVGSIAIMSMIEHLIEQDGVTSIDFGTDDDPYKSTWVKDRRERYGITYVRKDTLPGVMLYARLLLREMDLVARSSAKKILHKIGVGNA